MWQNHRTSPLNNFIIHFFFFIFKKLLKSSKTERKRRRERKVFHFFPSFLSLKKYFLLKSTSTLFRKLLCTQLEWFFPELHLRVYFPRPIEHNFRGLRGFSVLVNGERSKKKGCNLTFVMFFPAINWIQASFLQHQTQTKYPIVILNFPLYCLFSRLPFFRKQWNIINVWSRLEVTANVCTHNSWQW